jgi:hypothetical protein
MLCMLLSGYTTALQQNMAANSTGLSTSHAEQCSAVFRWILVLELGELHVGDPHLRWHAPHRLNGSKDIGSGRPRPCV